MSLMKVLASGAAAVLLAASPLTQAALFDFAAIADSEGERGFSSYVRTEGGIEVTATGTSVGDADATPDYFAYLDSGDAGLGVCKNLTISNQCTPSNDDNLTVDESLSLAFDQVVVIDEILFRNADHGTSFASDADFQVRIDGGAWMDFALTHMFGVDLEGTLFEFIASTTDGTIDGDLDSDQLYIEALTANAVPEPGTAVMLGLGLLGFGFARRTKLRA